MKKENLKPFLFKLANLVIIAGILAGYQSYAKNRQKKADAYTKELADYKKAQSAAESKYKDGDYEGVGVGFGGDITVKVTVKDHAVAKVSILSAGKETPEYLASAERLLEEIVSAQGTDVDTVTGATLSSIGILDAVDAALEKSRQ